MILNVSWNIFIGVGSEFKKKKKLCVRIAKRIIVHIGIGTDG